MGRRTIRSSLEIERLCARRREIWAGAPSEPGEAKRIAEKLDALYEERRMEQATERNSGHSRDRLKLRARASEEIDKLFRAPA